jgi:hypothetical protein
MALLYHNQVIVSNTTTSRGYLKKDRILRDITPHTRHRNTALHEERQARLWVGKLEVNF